LPVSSFCLMKVTLPIRWRLFGQAFLSLIVLYVVTLFVLALANRMGWNPIIPICAVLALFAGVSMMFALRITILSRSLAATIESRSMHEAERQSARLRGTLYEEAAVAWQAGLHSLQNSCFDKQIEATGHYTTLTDLMRMIAKAVDERTSYLRGHSDRVATYAAEIARELGIDSAEVERIRLAALLHDIGTLGIEDSIVMKDMPLTPEEFEIVKAHTVKGASILRPIEAIADLIPGVELHHESLDGQGYPYGLRGDEIPMMARIIAVADSFDAMTTARPYQSAMDPQYVLEVLNRLAGKRYDASAVNALTSLVKRGNIIAKSMRAPVSFPQRHVLSEIV
jgi:putative nucleotidyltransferase with HDIG domain